MCKQGNGYDNIPALLYPSDRDSDQLLRNRGIQGYFVVLQKGTVVIYPQLDLSQHLRIGESTALTLRQAKV
jgi:hypothetical protein